MIIVFGFRLSTCKNHCRIYKYIRLSRRKIFMYWWWTYKRVHFTCNLHYCTRINRHDWKQRGYALGKSVLIDTEKKQANRYQVSVNTGRIETCFLFDKQKATKTQHTTDPTTSIHPTRLNKLFISTPQQNIQPKNTNNTFTTSKQHQCLPTT